MARKKKVEAPAEIKVMRRNKESGEISEVPRGRPHPGYERGYVDAEGNFVVGEIPKKRGRKPGRKAASKPGPKVGRKRGRPVGSTNKSKVTGGGLSGRLNKLVEKAVSSRLRGLEAELTQTVRKQLIAELAG
jgi:hypothetical protein